MKRTRYYYTEKDCLELSELAKITTNVSSDAKKYAQKTGRSYKSVCNRLYRERISLGLVMPKIKEVDSLKKTSYFYTTEQVSLINKCLNENMNPTEISHKFHKNWGLSFSNLYNKTLKLKHKLNNEPAPITKIVVEQQPVQEMELQMSEGSTFDCKPSRVTICKDHIRIYF